jgi:hypothetical protein
MPLEPESSTAAFFARATTGSVISSSRLSLAACLSWLSSLGLADLRSPEPVPVDSVVVS